MAIHSARRTPVSAGLLRASCALIHRFLPADQARRLEKLEKGGGGYKNKAININLSITGKITDAEGRKDLKAFSTFQYPIIHSVSTRNSIVNYCF